jgi:hypothetical protein
MAVKQPKLSIQLPSKINQNWEFWCANISSGNFAG